MNRVPVGIVGLGVSVPERVLTNQDLEKLVETTDEWIVTRTGIRERRICGPHLDTSDIAAEAARRALDDAGLKPSQIDLIICCTITPDHFCPSTACMVQAKLGIKEPIPAFDLSAACSGFLYGLSVASSFINSGVFKRVLVIGAETMSKVIDFEDRNTCVLFGDGAGAVVVSQVEEGRGLLGQSLRADGSAGEVLIVPNGVSHAFTEDGSSAKSEKRRRYLTMSGNEVYKFATRILSTAVSEALADAGDGLQPHDLDLVVPHQANIRIIEVASRKLALPLDRFVINIDKYGNTSAATIPLALADARADGRLKRGALVALVAFGGGLTYASSIWRW